MSTLSSRIRLGLGKPDQDSGTVQETDQRYSQVSHSDRGREYGAMFTTPNVRIRIFPGVITYEDTYPLIAPDGAPISATGPGTWGQLYAAGGRR